MERRAHHVVLGLARYLYQYQLDHVGRLIFHLFPANNSPAHNISRNNGYLLRSLKRRFFTLPIETTVTDGERVRTREPHDHDKRLVFATLEHVTPWGTHCPNSGSLLALFNGSGDQAAEWQHFHALIHAGCAGLARLIIACQEKTTMPFENPDDMLKIPDFPCSNDAEGDHPDGTQGGDRFNPEALGDTEAGLVLDSWFRSQQRRRNCPTGLLQVRVDGEERAWFDPREGPCPPLQVSVDASYLEVYGRDDEGMCLLAVFPLYGLEDGDELRVRLEGGQRFRLTALSAAEAADQITLELRFWTAWHASPETLFQNLRRRLHDLYSYPMVPTCATGLILILLLSTSWLGTLYVSQRSSLVPGPLTSRGAVRSLTGIIIVGFYDDVTQVETQALLQEIGGQIVQGPSSTGVYHIEVSPEPAKPTNA